MVENIQTKVLNVPPPVLSRSFQQLANGLVKFHDGLMVASIPLPFPYAQTCDWLLLVHLIVTPLITAQWVSGPFWSFFFTFVQVLVFWSLIIVAMEIENPFGTDA